MLAHEQIVILCVCYFPAFRIHVSQYAQKALADYPEYHLTLKGQTEVKVNMDNVNLTI